MNIKSEPHVTLVITLTDDEARDIIADPSDFVSNLQDVLPNGAAKPKVPARGGTRRGGWKMQTTRCELCGRDIAAARFDRHMQAKHGA